MVPVKHATSYFSPFFFELNKSRFTNTCTTTGFVSGDGVRNLVLPCRFRQTAFHSTQTQSQRPGNYSLLQIKEFRKQRTVIVRTALHSGDVGFESMLHYQLWLYSFPPLSRAHSALLPSLLFLFKFYSHFMGVHSMFLCVSISLCVRA